VLATLTGWPQDNILVGSGIDDLLGLSVRCTIDPEDVAVASKGTYPTFAYHVTAYGGKLHTVPYNAQFKVDMDSLERAAFRYNARVVYIANPDNPTGTVHSAEAMTDLALRLPSHCTLLLDEAYGDFVQSGELERQTLSENVIRFRTFSKGHALAGLRIGYVLASGRYIEAFEKVRLHFGVNRIAQSAAVASLEDAKHLRAVVDAVAIERDLYSRMLRDLGWTPIPSSTNFISFDVGDASVAADLVGLLAERGVFVRRAGGPPLEGYVRITVGSAKQRRRLKEVLEDACFPGP